MARRGRSKGGGRADGGGHGGRRVGIDGADHNKSSSRSPAVPLFFSYERDLGQLRRSHSVGGDDDEQTYNTGISSFTSSFVGFAADDEMSECPANGNSKMVGRGEEKVDLWGRIGLLPPYADRKQDSVFAIPQGRKSTDVSEDTTDDDSRYMIIDSDESTVLAASSIASSTAFKARRTPRHEVTPRHAKESHHHGSSRHHHKKKKGLRKEDIYDSFDLCSKVSINKCGPSRLLLSDDEERHPTKTKAEKKMAPTSRRNRWSSSKKRDVKQQPRLLVPDSLQDILSDLGDDIAMACTMMRSDCAAMSFMECANNGLHLCGGDEELQEEH